MSQAEWALWISGLSAAFTASGLVWQFLLYRLSGARISVRLTPAFLLVGEGIVRGPDAGFDSRTPDAFASQLQGFGVELAQVEVTNVGRSPISVADVALDVGKTDPWWRRGRHTIRGHPVDGHGCVTEDRVRLEPGTTLCYLFDIWQVVEGARRVRPGQVTVRATAQPAGRRARRSPRRTQWRIPPGQASLRPGVEATSEVRAYWALWRAVRHDTDKLELLGMAWFRLQRLFRDGDVSLDKVTAELDEVLGPSLPLAAINVTEAFLGRNVFAIGGDPPAAPTSTTTP